MDKKRILLIAESNMSLSGVPVVYMSIVRTLQDLFDFDIIILKNNDMFFEKEFLSYGGSVYFFNFQKPSNIFKKLQWYAHGYNKQFKTFLKKNKLDLRKYSAVHSFNEYFSYPFFKEAKKAKINNVILHICSAASAYPDKKNFKQLIWNCYKRKALKYCSTILFVSKKSMLYNNYKNKGKVLYNIYDENKYNRIIPCASNELLLSQIGTFSSRKNQMFSIDVLKAIQKIYPNAVLNIVGKSINDGYAEKMVEYINKEKMGKSINILNTSTNRVELNKKTSFVLYPSTQDSFGLVLIESQASGIHCFASNLIPDDADMGNVEFLELDAKLWAERIVDFFKKNGNNRIEPQYKEKFSTKAFRNALIKTYN